MPKEGRGDFAHESFFCYDNGKDILGHIFARRNSYHPPKNLQTIKSKSIGSL